MSESSPATISEAFSRTAQTYESFGDDHPHLARMRSKVYRHFTSLLPPKAKILELNAGTGVDAVYLAQHGYQVHASDIAPGMLQYLRDKVECMGLQQLISIQECSFTKLDLIDGGPYDAVFSDLGGLNCIPDLTPVINSLPGVLRPGGVITWVLMPPICLWELGTAVTGNFRTAFRRLSRNGSLAHLEGLYFRVYYFSPRQVIEKFGLDYDLLALEGLSVITPTAESKNLARNKPRIYRLLSWFDDLLSPRPPWHGWGDFFIVSFRYTPKGGRGG